ncbi:response regulator transcription factor, partial [Amycolatopsis sp. SID8362]|uniref:response regulator transcription factor n=1 Tax=Amycolatopsis sp. SID8362 TaxID=2690346 RepID=UPI00136D6F59
GCLDAAERLGGAGRLDPGLLVTLGIALRLEHAYGGELANLEDAVEALRAGAAVVTDPPRRAALRSELGGALLMWFRLHDDPAALAEAVETLRDALSDLPAASPQRPQVLSQLAAALVATHERSAEPAGLEEALTVLREAIDAAATPNDEALANLGALLLTWAGYRDDVTSATEAIDVLRQASTRIPTDRPQRARVLANLSAAHRLRHERSGDPADLEQAAAFAREALAGTPEGTPEHAAVAAGYDAVLRTRHQLSGKAPGRPAPRPRPSVADVLLATADDDLAIAMTAALARSGFTVRRAASGEDVSESLDGARVVILDHEYLTASDARTLQQQRTGTAVIRLGPNTLDDRLAALTGGADDYLVKPFAVAELLARVHALNRRAARPPAAGADHVLRFGDVDLDLDRHEARIAGQPVPLSRKEFAILALLARKPGQTLSRAEILAEVWGTIEVATSRSLDVRMATLRAKLGRPQLIQSVRGIGYRLSPDY